MDTSNELKTLIADQLDFSNIPAPSHDAVKRDLTEAILIRIMIAINDGLSESDRIRFALIDDPLQMEDFLKKKIQNLDEHIRVETERVIEEFKMSREKVSG